MIYLISRIIGAIFHFLMGWYAKILQNNCNSSSKEIQDIPGPRTLPILGTRWLFSSGKFKMTEVHEYYLKMRNQYGSIFKEEALFNIPVISIFEKCDIEKVFRSTGKYPLRPPTEAIAKYRREHPKRYASTGLTNEQGEKWHFLRTSVTTVLTSPRTIQSFLPQMEAIADDLCYLLKQKRGRNGDIMNLEDYAGKLALEATCALVLGRRMGFLIDGQKCELAEKLSKAVHRNFIACRDTYFGIPFWRWFPTPAYKRLCDSERDIYELASELIRTADEDTKESAVFQSVLYADIDEREKKSSIVDFLAAGIHTLKNSLLFLLYQVAMHKECQQKILEDSTKNYLKACSTETFRISPTVLCLARIIESDLELSGYHLKAGTVVLCQTAFACQNETYFKDARKFRPERWLNEEKNDTAANAAFLVTPFGYGRRICPGKRYIEHVLPIILEKIIENFKIEVDRPMEIEFEFLLSPKCPVHMRFKDRV